MADVCRLTLGKRFATREAAESEVLDRRMNVAANGGGPVAEGDYQVKGCNCGSFHVMTRAQLERRKRPPRREQG